MTSLSHAFLTMFEGGCAAPEQPSDFCAKINAILWFALPAPATGFVDDDSQRTPDLPRWLISGPARRLSLMMRTGNKRVLKALGSLLGILCLLEVFSSYVLYRYYGYLNKDFFPTGSAAATLVLGGLNKAHGIHPKPKISLSNGPLFYSDPVLGFAMHPGHFRVAEELHDVHHYFDLTVDSNGNRITSYLPTNSQRRILMLGDSGLFGWGLNDEETIPWQVQQRLSHYQVVNLSINSYSTVQALLLLEKIQPRVGPDDIIVIEYHQPTNQLNVEARDVLADLSTGYELAIGGPGMPRMRLPYGYLDAGGRLAIGHVSLTCAMNADDSSCARPAFDMTVAMQVTNHAVDAIVAMHPAHVVIALMSAPDDDPVIAHARAAGVTIADLRRGRDTCYDDDVNFIDGHSGPFFSHQVAQRLVAILSEEKIAAADERPR
jgi:hypothetical protein